MPTNKRKREDLRRSSNAAHQAKLSFKKQKSSVSEMEEVSFKLSFQNLTCKIIAYILMDLFHYLIFLKNFFYQRNFYI